MPENTAATMRSSWASVELKMLFSALETAVSASVVLAVAVQLGRLFPISCFAVVLGYGHL